jgi:RNA polymerase sigma-70 factor, ECF subfamily
MPNTSHPDMLLVEQIRSGQPDAWNTLIAQYEGRLLSFVDSRLRRRASSEDVVQETFIGFLTSLPNYDTRRPLESYLFSIAAHKLTDYLRREGRRPALPLSSTAASEGGQWDMPGGARPASSIARSGERRELEEESSKKNPSPAASPSRSITGAPKAIGKK